MSEQMDLITVDVQNSVQIFTAGGLNAILDSVEQKVRSMTLDGSTTAGRDEIRSVAYQIIRTKTALDAEGKKLTEQWRRNTAMVNSERNKATERLDALAEEVRKPLTDFENKEKIRMAGHEAAISELVGVLEMLHHNPNMTAESLADHLRDYVALHQGRDWEEFAPRAMKAHGSGVAELKRRIEARLKSDADQAELEQLRKAEAERLQREHEERIAKNAAEEARLESERKAKAEADAEQKRVAVEAERVRMDHERIQREAGEREAKAKADQVAAEQRAKKAEAEKLAAEVRAAGELKTAREKADADAQLAAKREREKIAEENRKAEEARLKREADTKLKAKVRAEITEDIAEHSAHEIAELILAGKVRHVKVVF